jgi:tetratricopeptide (TPR) repeat protein
MRPGARFRTMSTPMTLLSKCGFPGYALLLLLISGCATRPAPISPPSPAEVAAADKTLMSAWQLFRDRRVYEADATLTQLIASNGFGGLDSAKQRLALRMGALTAVQSKDPQRGLRLAKRACAMPDNDGRDWEARLIAAEGAQDAGDATLALTRLARQWPDTLRVVESPWVGYAVARAPHAGTARYAMLKALFDANFARDDLDASEWWRDLALLELQRNETAAASQALSRVTDPYAIISVRADNRFAPARASLDSGLDVPTAALRQIEVARGRVERHPDQLRPIIDLTDALEHSLRHHETLRVVDDVIARINGPEGKKAYTDYDKHYVWLLDARSQALSGLGRWDEAVAQLQTASELPEEGGANVSQVINLAGLYNQLGRPREAREVLAVLTSRIRSPYGDMQAEIETFDAAVQLGDKAEASRALKFMREHQQDSMSTYERALVIADRPDDALQLLVARLGNREQRVDALIDVQTYLDEPLTPRSQTLRRRWQAVVDRPAVRSAIAEVGSVEAYPLSRPSH